MSMHVQRDPNTAAARMAVTARPVAVEADPSCPSEVVSRFQDALTAGLAGRSGGYRVRLARGRDAEEVMVVIKAEGRKAPLPLFFPHAPELQRDDIVRIVRNVLEAMGPAFT
jgi:hypothetical protein